MWNGSFQKAPNVTVVCTAYLDKQGGSASHRGPSHLRLRGVGITQEQVQHLCQHQAGRVPLRAKGVVGVDVRDWKRVRPLQRDCQSCCTSKHAVLHTHVLSRR